MGHHNLLFGNEGHSIDCSLKAYKNNNPNSNECKCYE